jgi:AcrR family transcriptional regulator
MSSIPAVPKLNPPKQARSRRTLERIENAALSLLEEDGMEGTTVAAIVARSGTSVGSFYARFEGKDDLLQHLRDRVWSEAREKWDSAVGEKGWEALSIDQVIEGVVGLLLRSFRTDSQSRRVLRNNSALDREGARRILDFHEHLLSTVGPLLLARQNEILHPEPERAVELGYRMTVGAIREFLELEDLGAGPDPESLAPELAKAWLSYLGAGPWGPGGLEEGEVDFFDPWG